MTDEAQSLVQRCLELSPTLTWLNDPAHDHTLLWLFLAEVLVHAVACVWLMSLVGGLIGRGALGMEWLVRTTWRGWRQWRAG